MHSMLSYLLGMAGIILLMDRLFAGLVPPGTSQALRLSVSVLLVGTGGWFSLIGIGFFLFGDRGILGEEHGGAEVDHGAISLLLAVMFLITMTMVGGAWAAMEFMLSKRHLDSKEEDSNQVELQGILDGKRYVRVGNGCREEGEREEEVVVDERGGRPGEV